MRTASEVGQAREGNWLVLGVGLTAAALGVVALARIVQ